MKQRVITGAIGGIVFALFMYFGGIWLWLVLLLATIIGIKEFVNISKNEQTMLAFTLTSLTAAIVFMQTVFLYNFFAFEFIISLLLLYLAVPVITKNSFDYNKITLCFITGLYISIGFYSVHLIREDTGFIFAFMIMLAIWATDTGAYFTGLAFRGSGPKLWPAISPKKTVVGAVGGWLLATLVVFLIYPYSNIDVFVYNWQLVLLATAIAVFGQLGDLVESSYKRVWNVKDSGTILPGHGGVLDRFDSVLYVFPIVYVLLQII